MKLNRIKNLYCINCGSKAVKRNQDIHQKNHGSSLEFQCRCCGELFGWPVGKDVYNYPGMYINLFRVAV